MSSTRSLSGVGVVGRNNNNYGSEIDDDDDDDISCDDTYVSIMSRSSRHTIGGSGRSPPRSGRKQQDSRRILGETFRVSNSGNNNSAVSPLRSSSPYNTNTNNSDKKKYTDGIADNSSSPSISILDKLKNDIDSLEKMRFGSSTSSTRQQQQDKDFPEMYSENEFSHQRSNSTSKLSSSVGRITQSSDYRPSHRSVSSMSGVGRGVVDRDDISVSSGYESTRYKSPLRSSFHTTDQKDEQKEKTNNENDDLMKRCRQVRSSGIGSDKDGYSSDRSITFLSDQTYEQEEKECRGKTAIEYEELVKKVRLLEHEKGRLQETVRTMKEDSTANIKHTENKLSAFSNVKEQLEESKAKEAELTKALSELVSNVESEQENMMKELATSHKLRKSEVALLEEKLKSASEEMTAKEKAFSEIENEVQCVEKTLQHEKEEAVQHLTEKIESLETDIQSNENGLRGEFVRLNRELDGSREAYSELVNKKTELSNQLSESKSQIEEGKEAIADSQQELQEIKDKNQALANKLDSATKQVLTEKLDNETKKKIIRTLEQALAEAKKAEDQCGSLKYLLDKKNVQIDELEKNQAEFIVAQNEHELGVTKIKEQIAALEEEKLKQESVIEQLSTTVTESKAMYDENEAAFKSKYDQSEVAFKSSIDKAKQANDQMKSKFVNVEKEVDTLKVIIQEKDEQLLDMEKTATEMITSLRSKVQIKDKQLKQVSKATEQMHKKVNSLKIELDTYKTKKVPAYEAEVSKLKVKITESNTKESMAKQEISSLQAELVRVNDRLQSSKDSHHELQKQMEAKSTDGHNKESKLNSSIHKLQSKLSNTMTSLEQAEEKVEMLRAEGNSRNGQLKSAMSSLDEMMKYIETMREDHFEEVLSLQKDIEKAMKLKQDSESTLKKR